jgi:hypothetical protein
MMTYSNSYISGEASSLFNNPDTRANLESQVDHQTRLCAAMACAVF